MRTQIEHRLPIEHLATNISDPPDPKIISKTSNVSNASDDLATPDVLHTSNTLIPFRLRQAHRSRLVIPVYLTKQEGKVDGSTG